VKTILILDLETTGVTPGTDRIVEVGLLLYSVTHRSTIRAMSSVVDSGVGNPAESINRVPGAILGDGITPDTAYSTVRSWMGAADAVIGHNIVDFDRMFLPPDIQTLRPFIDTCNDLLWPRQQKPGEGLVKLALAHDLGVSHAHRAAVDCDLLARLLTRVHELGVDLGPFLERGLRPKAQFQAMVSYDDRELAKTAGFKWNEDGSRRWLRKMPIEDAAALPFPTRQVEASPARAAS